MTESIYFEYYKSPIGMIEIGCKKDRIVTLSFVEEPQKDFKTNLVVETAKMQIIEFFSGTRILFDIPLAPEGTVFQQEIWSQLSLIPFGSMVSYQYIARAANNPKAVRAVGAANGKNPIPIIIPCHRIIGKNGKLTGYGGGLWRKEWLLRHEGCII